MTLLFTTLFSSGAMAAPPLPPEPPFVWTTNLLYRFSASEGAASDDERSPASDGDPVARWLNLGSAEDAVQTTPARQPVYRTGGLNGRPYIACDRALEQHFEDLAFSQPSGFSNFNPFTVFVVTDAIGELDQFPAILGSPASNGGKMGFYFRDPEGGQIHWIKSQIRVGNVASPQLIMAAAGRNAAGTTSSGHVRYWVRQNRAGLWEAASQTSNLVSTAIASTQFLRSTGVSTGGLFHGRLYEFLFYEGTLDDAATFAIEDWLMARYAIA
jgi:hypothetical protein